MPAEAAIDLVKDEVADNLEEIAAATRRINARSMGFALGGAGVGLIVGIFIGYKLNKEKIRAEAFAKSEEEVQKIRDLYQQKAVAATPKPSVEQVIEERGYERPLPAPVPGLHEPIVVVPPPVVIVEEPAGISREWDYMTEMRARAELDEGEPYVIHQDEFMGKEKDYAQVTYTYYAIDDVLVDDENDHPLPHPDIVVGVNNLQFGHGTDSEDVVFVRNDKLQLDMEICRLNKSFEEEVLGIDPHVSETEDDDES